MRRTTFALAAAFALGTPVAYAQCGPEHTHAHGAQSPCGQKIARAETGYRASGTVKKVDAAAQSVTIAHEPVRQLNWPGMTMAFKVKDAALLEKLKPGAQIDFTFVAEAGRYVITSAK
jgi:Cu(I)/Ag(I) efflux system protein CusF